MCWDRMYGWMQRRGKGSGKRGCEYLLGFVWGGDVEGQAAVVVGLSGGSEVEIGEGNFFGAGGSETPEGLAYDGVVAAFLLVLVAEDQDCGRNNCGSLLFIPGVRPSHRAGTSVDILVAVGFFLAAHSLLFETLLVHLVGYGSVLLVVLIVVLIIGRARIPPPVGIIESAVGIGIEVATPAAVAVAIVAERESLDVMVVGSAI